VPHRGAGDGGHAGADVHHHPHANLSAGAVPWMQLGVGAALMLFGLLRWYKSVYATTFRRDPVRHRRETYAEPLLVAVFAVLAAGNATHMFTERGFPFKLRADHAWRVLHCATVLLAAMIQYAHIARRLPGILWPFLWPVSLTLQTIAFFVLQPPPECSSSSECGVAYTVVAVVVVAAAAARVVELLLLQQQLGINFGDGDSEIPNVESGSSTTIMTTTTTTTAAATTTTTTSADNIGLLTVLDRIIFPKPIHNLYTVANHVSQRVGATFWTSINAFLLLLLGLQLLLHSRFKNEKNKLNIDSVAHSPAAAATTTTTTTTAAATVLGGPVEAAPMTELVLSVSFLTIVLLVFHVLVSYRCATGSTVTGVVRA